LTDHCQCAGTVDEKKKGKPYCYRLTETFLSLAKLALGEFRRFDFYGQ